jgi:hypothetical protein
LPSTFLARARLIDQFEHHGSDISRDNYNRPPSPPLYLDPSPSNDDGSTEHHSTGVIIVSFVTRTIS